MFSAKHFSSLLSYYPTSKCVFIVAHYYGNFIHFQPQVYFNKKIKFTTKKNFLIKSTI